MAKRNPKKSGKMTRSGPTRRSRKKRPMARKRREKPKLPDMRIAGALVVVAIVALSIWRMPQVRQGRVAGEEYALADPATQPVETWRAQPGEVAAFADTMARRSAAVLAGLGVPRNAIEIKRLPEQRNSTMRWEVVSDVPADLPLPICNLELTRMAGRLGGQVLEGRQDLRGDRLSMLFGLDGERTALISLRKSAKLQRTHGRIALIVDDVGYQDRALIRALCDLKQPVTLSIFPHEKETVWAAGEASKAGHGVMVHLPMEPHDYPRWNPGEDAIFVDQAPEDVRKLTRDALTAVPYATGVNNHMGSRVTENRRIMTYVMEEVKDLGFFFVDSATSRLSVAYDTGVSHGVAVGRNVQFVDLVDEEAAIRTSMRDLAAKARQYGTAIGIGHAKPKTLAVLEEMLPVLEEEGVTFVTVGETLR